ncbi:MAG TPA: carboxypeptidase-like regulatory domain-containing protein, partial [Chitinivibrionales bacterium]
MTSRTFLTVVTIVTALVAVTCVKNSEFTGPSTEQGNPQIVAVVVDGKNNPVLNALVSVYQVPLNADTLNQPSAAILVATSATDCVGTCSFDKLIPGMYSLKAIDADSSHATIKTNIPISAIKPDKPEYQDTLVLAIPGSMGGVVSRGGVAGTNQNQSLKDAFIQIKIGEIDRSTVTGPSGAYFFSNLPAGTYTVYYYATDGFYSAKRENIVVSTVHT